MILWESQYYIQYYSEMGNELQAQHLDFIKARDVASKGKRISNTSVGSGRLFISENIYAVNHNCDLAQTSFRSTKKREWNGSWVDGIIASYSTTNNFVITNYLRRLPS